MRKTLEAVMSLGYILETVPNQDEIPLRDVENFCRRMSQRSTVDVTFRLRK